jgi:pyruvate/2-oxoglutarate dehydrogenase complex dihydrolipoamide dehydrogenase (E3) component
MTVDVDAVVLGLGPGGEEVAGRLAEAGLAVVGIEQGLVGGECPYWACVPTKMMVRAAGALAEARRVPDLAGEARVRPDWTPVAGRIRDEATDNWDDTVAVDRFTGKGGRFVRGQGRLAGPGRVAVGDEVYAAARAVVVATGTQPLIPPVDGLAETPYWTNRDAVAVPSPPASLAVLGGGAVGLELAQVFARFGVEVTVIENADRVLAADEPEASTVVAEALGRDGVAVRVGVSASRVANDGSVFTLTLDDGSTVVADRLLVSAGRRTDLAAVGVDSVGLDPSARFIEVDERLRAGQRLWAVGDVTGRGAFTHVAMYQADIAVRSILDQDGPPADYRALPRVTFTDPEVGSVGRTEAAARDAGVRVRTSVASVPSSARGWIHKAGNDGLIKLVADDERGVLIGATSVGPAGGEVLGTLGLAVHAEVPLDRLRHMIYAYPTFYRAISDALRSL